MARVDLLAQMLGRDDAHPSFGDAAEVLPLPGGEGWGEGGSPRLLSFGCCGEVYNPNGEFPKGIGISREKAQNAQRQNSDFASVVPFPKSEAEKICRPV